MSSGGRQALQIWHIADPSKFKAGPTLGVGILGKWHSLLKLNVWISNTFWLVLTFSVPNYLKFFRYMKKSVAYSFAITGKRRQLV